jgi:hypothetical protein
VTRGDAPEERQTGRPHWLLLAHQLPTRPSNARVKTWRRLQEIGAIPTRNSVYVLPNTEQCREDFEWLRSEIVALGGEATVFAAAVVDAAVERELIDAFRHARREDYERVREEAARRAPKGRGSRSRGRGAPLTRAVRVLRGRLSAIEQIDFFQAAGRDEAGEAVAALERLLEVPRRAQPHQSFGRLDPAKFQKRRWVTRPRPGVDRMSSAWLIRRFIDPAATFDFVTAPAHGDIAFDMYEGDFGHQGSLCTFETLARRFGVTAPSVQRIGQIVHDLDMKESRYGAAETAAVGRLIDGLRQMYGDDHELLEQGIASFEALARSFDSSARTKRRGGQGTRERRDAVRRRARKQ